MKTNKELLKENPQLKVDKKPIETYELYIDVFNACIDNYEKTFKEFEGKKEKNRNLKDHLYFRITIFLNTKNIK